MEIEAKIHLSPANFDLWSVLILSPDDFRECLVACFSV